MTSVTCLHFIVQEEDILEQTKGTCHLCSCKPLYNIDMYLIHSKLCNITLVATKMHGILWSFVVLIWMCDTLGLV